MLAQQPEFDQQKVTTPAVTTTPKAWPRNYARALRSKLVRAALGLHAQEEPTGTTDSVL